VPHHVTLQRVHLPSQLSSRTVMTLWLVCPRRLHCATASLSSRIPRDSTPDHCMCCSLMLQDHMQRYAELDKQSPASTSKTAAPSAGAGTGRAPQSSPKSPVSTASTGHKLGAPGPAGGATPVTTAAGAKAPVQQVGMHRLCDVCRSSDGLIPN